MNDKEIKEAVKEKYSRAALDAAAKKSGCCGPEDCCAIAITSDLYGVPETT